MVPQGRSDGNGVGTRGVVMVVVVVGDNQVHGKGDIKVRRDEEKKIKIKWGWGKFAY